MLRFNATRLPLACLLWIPIGMAADATTLTGWFSDEQCAAPRVKAGFIGPTNPDCAKKCIDNDARAVFISEQHKRLFFVKNYASVTEDLGYKVEVTGRIDEASGTISLTAVKRLDYEGAACSRPRKRSPK